MAEELPDGTRGGYGAYCERCGKEISVNYQGNVTDHTCMPLLTYDNSKQSKVTIRANSNPPDGLSIAIYDSVKNITVWLQNKEGVIVLTEAEFERLAGKIYDSGFVAGHADGADIIKYTSDPSKEDYIKSLLP